MHRRLKQILLLGLLIGMFGATACLVRTRPARHGQGLHENEHPEKHEKHEKHKKHKKQKKHKKHKSKS